MDERKKTRVLCDIAYYNGILIATLMVIREVLLIKMF